MAARRSSAALACSAASALALAACGGGDERAASPAEAERCLAAGGGIVAQGRNPYGLAALALPVLELSHPPYPDPRQVRTRIFFARSHADAERSRQRFVAWMRELVAPAQVPDEWFDERVAVIGVALLDSERQPARATRELLARCLSGRRSLG